MAWLAWRRMGHMPTFWADPSSPDMSRVCPPSTMTPPTGLRLSCDQATRCIDLGGGPRGCHAPMGCCRARRHSADPSSPRGGRAGRGRHARRCDRARTGAGAGREHGCGDYDGARALVLVLCVRRGGGQMGCSCFYARLVARSRKPRKQLVRTNSSPRQSASAGSVCTGLPPGSHTDPYIRAKTPQHPFGVVGPHHDYSPPSSAALVGACSVWR
jgi:hypothetical protein